MSTDDTRERRLGWHWLWFGPVCAAMLYSVEGHTAPNAFRLLKLGYHRWSWGALFSPSAFFCLVVMAASIYWPIQGLALTASFVTADDEMPRRYLIVILLVVAVFVLPFVTDFLTWGSFPFNIDNDGASRLRMIPFIPWPNGQFGEY